MKPSEENLRILKKLGFSCDFDRTKDHRDKLYYSDKSGWGFHLDYIRDFKHLLQRIRTTAKEEWREHNK